MNPVIVCVDDERMVLDALKEQLGRQLGGRFDIETAESGQDALHLLEDLDAEGATVVAVISDHIMPGMKGDELLAQVRARWPRTRNILLTGQANADAVGRAVNAGNLYRFIAKPWSSADLTLTLDQAADGYFQEIELEAERETLSIINRVALDLSANLAAESRYRRLLDGARTALTAEGAVLCAVWSGHVQCMACEGFAGALPGHELGGAPRALMERAMSTAGAVREGPLVAIALRFEDMVAGGLLLSMHPGRPLAEGRLQAFAALAAAVCRTAALVDALENDAERRRQLARALQREANADIDGPLAGQSPSVIGLRAQIDAAGTHDLDLVVTGQPGSGREAIARAAHRASARRDHAFIVVNSPVQRALGASIFVPVKGATRSTLELVHGGSLYLHEVDALAPEERARITAYVAERDAARAAGQPPSPDVRLIVSRGAEAFPPPEPRPWGEPSVTLPVPPLRERLDDIGALSAVIIEKHARRHGRPIEGLSPEARQRLTEYPWPGNYSELVNVLQRAVDTARGVQIEASDLQLSSTTRFGQYRLLGRLGAGGMGEVWVAEHESLAREAAVKLVRPQFGSASNKETVLPRFRREAQTTARLRSPHTVQLYDFGVSEDGTFYYAMERLEGMDLATMVRDHGRLPPERAIWFLRQACRSLIEAHGNGLVHRDIKPANLFAAQLGVELDFTKVLDFGLVFAHEPDLRLTAPGKVAGTPGFMAPEQASGQFDQRSDLYALGCVGFFLLTGRSVFQGPNPMAILLKHATEAPPAPSSLAPGIPAELDALILDCLSKRPSDRPGSASELWARLGQVPLERPWTAARAAEWWKAAMAKDSGPTDRAN